MLVLTRKVGEAIQIGDGISVVVLDVQGGRVRLGFNAPTDVKIKRSELLVDDEPPIVAGRSAFAGSLLSPVPLAGW